MTYLTFVQVHTMPELCDYCGKSFPSKKFLRIHVINIHLGDSDRPNRSALVPFSPHPPFPL